MGYIIPLAMTSDQYKLALGELRLGQRDLARFLGVHPDTGKKWAQNGPPPPIAKWVKYLIATQRSPADIDAAIARG
jgi:hypothetical protein